MNYSLPTAYLARHGETAWSLTGQHTGLTDLPLTEHGERTARNLGDRLKELIFARVFNSHCNVQGAPANWPASERSPKLIPTWSNGITESMRVSTRRISVRCALADSRFTTDAPEASRHSRLRRALIAS